jgi:hypothetical protein
MAFTERVAWTFEEMLLPSISGNTKVAANTCNSTDRTYVIREGAF